MRPLSKTARVALKTILVVVLSITSLVLARALIGVEITVDAVPVAKGEVDGTYLELNTLPTWQADGDLRLYFDDDTREDAFARILDGDVVVTTVEFGTETLVDYLHRQGIEGTQVPIESSCEIMDVDHPLFGVLCAAYDPSRQPLDHPDAAGLTCSTCHASGELEAAYERATSLVVTGATPPEGHREIGTLACSTCHAGATADGVLAPGGPTPPPGHRPIGTAVCSSCHGSTPGADAGDPVLTPPPGHRPIGDAVCSSCHAGTPDAGAGDPVLTPPPGHRPIGDAVCSSCHAGTPGDEPGGPVPTLPSDHRPIGDATCSSCHGSGGFDDDDEEDHEDEHDEDHEDEHDEEDDDEHDD